MWIATLILLTISNIFMTFAWYGHLKHTQTALWVAVLVSWLIAFLEYCFQVPANRLGSEAGLATAQLKTIQEVITLTVFCVFSLYYLKEPLKWNYLVGFCFIAFGALFVFAPWQQAKLNVDLQENVSRTLPSPPTPTTSWCPPLGEGRIADRD
jgi:uncharacterized protein (DUF486 family)